MPEKLTPTEDLLIELLVARHRLGENLWTFDSRHKKALESLETKGYVSVMHGVVENSIRAHLTDKGKDKFMSSTYVAPLIKKARNDMTIKLVVKNGEIKAKFVK